MPELPEVTTIVAELNDAVVGKTIKEVIFKDARLLKAIKPQAFAKEVVGQKIVQALRRGKVIILKLQSGKFIIIHLRISGWLLLAGEEGKHSRIILKLSDGKLLNFCDGRVLGELRLVDDWHDLNVVKTMGPEPLDISKQEFVKLFEGKKTKIKPLLMDQHFLAGVGNIYAQEAVFCAEIHPEKAADKIEKKDLEKLYDCLIRVLKEGIKHKGTSADSYFRLDGSKGTHVEHLMVYQRDGEPCVKCKKPLIRITTSGRGTVFCPHCQK
jgi:formamidopyrimidine-DNA glycosylase